MENMNQSMALEDVGVDLDDDTLTVIPTPETVESGNTVSPAVGRAGDGAGAEAGAGLGMVLGLGLGMEIVRKGSFKRRRGKRLPKSGMTLSQSK
jgi:hypothetical protein